MLLPSTASTHHCWASTTKLLPTPQTAHLQMPRENYCPRCMLIKKLGLWLQQIFASIMRLLSACCLYRQIFFFEFRLSCIWVCKEPFFPKHLGFDIHSPDFIISNNSATTETCANEEICQCTVSFFTGAGQRGKRM